MTRLKRIEVATPLHDTELRMYFDNEYAHAVTITEGDSVEVVVSKLHQFAEEINRKQTELSASPHWTDAHITFNTVTGLYTGWDETGVDSVCSDKDRSVVVTKMNAYAVKIGASSSKRRD